MNNSSKLARNFQEGSIINLLMEAYRDKSVVKAWRVINGHKLTVECNLKIVRKSKNEIAFNIPSDKVKVFKQILGPDGTINFHIEKHNILFQAVMIELAPSNEATFKMPNMVAHQDRRKSIRVYNRNKKNSVKYEKESKGKNEFNHKLEKPLQDISTGGFSIILTQTEAKLHKIDEEINFIVITLNNKSHRVRATLVNLIEIQPDKLNKLNYASFKACFQFSLLSENTLEGIENFVLENVEYTKIA